MTSTRWAPGASPAEIAEMKLKENEEFEKDYVEQERFIEERRAIAAERAKPVEAD